MKEIYIKKSDAEQAVKAYAKACIEQGELATDTADMSMAMIRLLNTLPQILIGEECDHTVSGLLEDD